ncbi:MAG: DUF481 domain-containing protein [Bacteroidota bacterium]
MKITKLTIAVFFLLLFSNMYAQNDTLYTATGDMLIGEIKSMSRNVLTFDTDYADSEFKVEWANVDGLISKATLQIYTTDGEKFTGNLAYDKTSKRTVQLINSDNDRSLTLDEIVEIATLSSSFLDRLYISIDAGYSLTKANHLSQLTTNGRANYNGEKWVLGAGFNNVNTSQDDAEPTTRNEANVDFSRDIYGKAFAFIGMEFLESSELNLDLRTTSKIGVGYYFFRTNGMFLQGGVGLANANEKYSGADPKTENSFEGLGAVEFDAYDIGDFSFRAKINAFPSFSNKGRVRINSDVSLKWDLPMDFYIKASFIHNYDTQPIVEGIDKGDFVFQTGIGWEWD